MNAKLILPLVALAAALGGCATSPQYPVTYQVPISNPVITSDYGPASLSVNGVQDVPATPGQLLYFQVLAPMNMVFYAFDKTGSGPGGPLLGQMQGTTLYSSVLPTGNTVEFVFSSTQPVTGGTVQLTVSDHAMTSGSSAIPYTTPGPMGSVAPSAAMQPMVSISPPNTAIAIGQSVTFTVAGGAGTGNFVWQGAAPAMGWSNTYTFNAPGTYTITVYRSGDGTYARSNTASAMVTVSAAATAMPMQGNPAVTVTPAQ
jgi:hypothetical protein